MNPDVAESPGDDAYVEQRSEPLTNMAGGFAFTTEDEEAKKKKPKNDKPDASNSSQSEAVDEGEIRDLFKKDPDPRSLRERKAEDEKAEREMEKERDKEDAIIDGQNRQRQIERDALIGHCIAERDAQQNQTESRLVTLANQAERVTAAGPTFNERANARREAAEAQGSSMPARGTSQPSPPSPDNPSRGTRGLSR